MPRPPPLAALAVSAAAALAALQHLAHAAPPVVPPPAAEVRVFEDWRLVCRGGCTLSTAVRSAAPRAGELVRAGIGGAPGTLTLSTPLPLYLPAPLEVAIGDAPPRVLPWLTCRATGCEARLPLDDAVLAALRRERSASVAFTLLDGERVRLSLSLMGFTAGERALRAAAP